MKNYFIGYDKENGIRHQPWTTAEVNEGHQYYDLRRYPELTRTSLEDLKLWDSHEEIQKLYDLLEWLNGPDSVFETNDTALRDHLQENEQTETFPAKYVLMGRLMVFLRDLKRNVSPDVVLMRPINPNPMFPDFSPSDDIEWFVNRSLQIIDGLHLESELTCVGIELYRTRYEELPGSVQEQTGYELNYKFWAWGDYEVAIFKNVGVIVDTLQQTFKTVQSELEGRS